MAMNNIALAVGVVVMTLGGILLTSALILLLGQAVLLAWISFSDKFRAICKAESLIFEYRKNREKFMEWNRMVEDGKGKVVD